VRKPLEHDGSPQNIGAIFLKGTNQPLFTLYIYIYWFNSIRVITLSLKKKNKETLPFYANNFSMVLCEEYFIPVKRLLYPKNKI